MTEDPIPVVVFRPPGPRHRHGDSQLEEGAVEVLAKPQLGVRDFLHDSAETLIEVIREAAEVRVRRREVAAALLPRHSADWVLPPAPSATHARRRSDRLQQTDLVVPSAHRPAGPKPSARSHRDAGRRAGLIIVQHMPERSRRHSRRRLDQLCRIEVKEAVAGDRVHQGRALIAPETATSSLRATAALRGRAVRRSARVATPTSVDVLFRS